MRVAMPLLILVASLAAGCHHDDSVVVPDAFPPAPPRGVYSVTGDEVAYLSWLHNTEPDVAGYRVYVSDCADGPGCQRAHAPRVFFARLRAPKNFKKS